MDIQRQQELFRLSAVLYADNNNYGVNIKTIYRKIIESALLEINKQDSSVHEVINFIHNNYNITISEDLINDITQKEVDKFHSNNRKGEIFICLTEKRKILITERVKDKDIDFFIKEFEGAYPMFNNSKDIIYKFLYEVFSTNTDGFQKLLNKRKDIKELFNPDSNNYNEKEKEVINNFLSWDNPEKNKAIFDISSYALEYCMLTNKEGGTSIELRELKNKNFYLDTNIIYRGLGINGDNRKDRTRTFLKKFLDAEEILKISKSSDREFKESIKIHVDKINTYNTPRIKSDVFKTFNVQQDMYNFYHTWRCGKVNTSIEMFHAELLSLYTEFKKEFKIDFEGNEPFERKNKDIKEQLELYTSEINSFKGGDSPDKAEYDAESILWIETKRNGNAENIFDTKHFFISTDQGLRNWDYQRKNLTPIVLLPSQWMTIVLRYFQCTNDDYKSFISFLNLRNNEKLLDGESLHIILAGISEMTSNVEQQKAIMSNLIANSFNSVVKKGSTDNQIFEKAKAIAKTELEKMVETQQADIENLSVENKNIQEKYTQANDKIDTLIENLEQNDKDTTNKIAEIKDDFDSLKEISIKMSSENEELKKKLRDLFIKEGIKKWKKPAIYSIPLIVLIAIFFLLQLFFKDWEYNIGTKFINWIDSIPSDTIKYLLRGVNLALFTSLCSLCVFAFRRLFHKSSINHQKEEIKKSEKYKSI